MKQYRQGDVYLLQITDIPKNLKECSPKRGRFILAEGEATGHNHSIKSTQGVLLVDKQNNVFLHTEKGCQLMHQEHAAVAIDSGTYQVIRQKEYTPAGIRNVAD